MVGEDNSSHWDAISASFLLILTSEIGDKTFFIEALLAAKGPKSSVFFGSILANSIMIVLGSFLGLAIFWLIDPNTVSFLAGLAFLVFALVALREAWYEEDGDSSDEEEEIEKRIGAGASWKKTFLTAFGLIFAAEFGDRSQLGVITLSAKYSPFPVILGALSSQALCTLSAVMAGKFLSRYVSERVMNYIAAALFTIFGLALLIA